MVKKVASWASPCMWLVRVEEEQDLSEARAHARSQAHSHGPRALEVTFSSQKMVAPPTFIKNWRTHMTWCQQERATVEEMTCQPTDLPNDFWLSAQGEMFHLSLCSWNERPKTWPAIFTLTQSTKVERGKTIKTDQLFPSCFWPDDPDIVSNHTRGMT